MFDLGPAAPSGRSRSKAAAKSPSDAVAAPPCPPEGMVVRVVPDVGAITRLFDYVVPPTLAGADLVEVGTMVRIPLHGRRVGAWVVAVDVDPPAGVALKAITKVTGVGPPAELVELARWAAWRWAGPMTAFLGTASPPLAVRTRPSRSTRVPDVSRAGETGGNGGSTAAPPIEFETAGALAPNGQSVVRIPPGRPVMPLIRAAVELGPALVLLPSLATAELVARRLRHEGRSVALHPRDWVAGAAGATVVGTRAAAWAPVADLAAIVVVDEHDEVYQEERAPTWHARDVAVERARRAGVPCVLTSPCPTLEAAQWGNLVVPTRGAERAGWPAVDLVDRRREDQGRLGLYSDALVRGLRAVEHGRVLCVLNRTGRARLLACRACGELARCERCAAALVQVETPGLLCPACGLERPSVCAACGATKLKARRLGVTRVRDELEALAGEAVAEVTAATKLEAGLPPTSEPRIVVGTEAVLHQAMAMASGGSAGKRSAAVGLVAFLDFDQELLAPRYRAAEQAMALLGRAARLLGPRERGGRLLVQTTMPDHPVLQAVLRADPTIVSDDEVERRRALDLPPFAATAAITGEAAAAFVEALGEPAGVDVLGPADGRWLLRAAHHGLLCDALAATPRPGGRLRVEVDPLRI